jgi:hypothetical protein
MPTFVSNKGVWYPAKEKIGLTNVSEEDIVYKGKRIKPGEPFVYAGPDREAVKRIKEENGEDGETLGTDFRTDPDFIQATRTMGFNTVEEYLKMMGYDEEADNKKFKEKASSVKAHEPPVPVDETYIPGGGRNTAGDKSQDLTGGFGDQRVRPADEVRRSKVKKGG